MRHSYATFAAIVVLVTLTAGCAARSAYSRGDAAARAGDWDAAVEQYRRALQEDPQNVQYRIAYERANLSAAGIHIDAARLAEARGQLDQALMEFRRASEYDPANRAIAGKVLDLTGKVQRGRSRQSSRCCSRAAAPASRVGAVRAATCLHRSVRSCPTVFG